MEENHINDITEKPKVPRGDGFFETIEHMFPILKDDYSARLSDDMGKTIANLLELGYKGINMLYKATINRLKKGEE